MLCWKAVTIFTQKLDNDSFQLPQTCLPIIRSLYGIINNHKTQCQQIPVAVFNKRTQKWHWVVLLYYQIMPHPYYSTQFKVFKNYVYQLTPSGFVIIKCVQCLFRFSWHCPPLNVIIAHKALESALLVWERHALTAVKSWSLSGKKPLVLITKLRKNMCNTYLNRNRKNENKQKT